MYIVYIFFLKSKLMIDVYNSLQLCCLFINFWKYSVEINVFIKMKSEENDSMRTSETSSYH